MGDCVCRRRSTRVVGRVPRVHLLRRSIEATLCATSGHSSSRVVIALHDCCSQRCGRSLRLVWRLQTKTPPQAKNADATSCTWPMVAERLASRNRNGISLGTHCSRHRIEVRTHGHLRGVTEIQHGDFIVRPGFLLGMAQCFMDRLLPIFVVPAFL